MVNFHWEDKVYGLFCCYIPLVKFCPGPWKVNPLSYPTSCSFAKILQAVIRPGTGVVWSCQTNSWYSCKSHVSLQLPPNCTHPLLCTTSICNLSAHAANLSPLRMLLSCAVVTLKHTQSCVCLYILYIYVVLFFYRFYMCLYVFILFDICGPPASDSQPRQARRGWAIALNGWASSEFPLQVVHPSGSVFWIHDLGIVYGCGICWIHASHDQLDSIARLGMVINPLLGICIPNMFGFA